MIDCRVCPLNGTTSLAKDERGFVRSYVALRDIGACEVSTVAISTCNVTIGFHAPGGTQFAQRTGSATNMLITYLSIYGPAGLARAVPQVPKAGADSTFVCTVPDPAALPLLTTTVKVSAVNPDKHDGCRPVHPHPLHTAPDLRGQVWPHHAVPLI